MNSPDTRSIRSVSPFFIVEDYATSVAYYRDVLGFAVEYEAPEDESPFFGIVARDGSLIVILDEKRLLDRSL